MEVRLFGEFEVVREGVAIPVRGAKQRALLALLALNRGNPVSADRLIDQLWGDGQTAKPANALQAQIVQLRRTLGASAIVTSESGYALDISAAGLDAARFEDLVAEGRRRMFLARLGRSWRGLSEGTMAAGKLGAEVLEPIPVSCAQSEVGNDAQSERVAANAGEMFTEQIGGSTDVAGGRGADHFNVMAFPAHRVANGGTWGCFGDGGEIGDGEPEAGIGHDSVPERLYGDGRVRGLLCLAIEGGSLDVGRDHPTVVLGRRSSWDRLATARTGLFWVAMHDYQVALVT